MLKNLYGVESLHLNTKTFVVYYKRKPIANYAPFCRSVSLLVATKKGSKMGPLIIAKLIADDLLNKIYAIHKRRN